MKIGGVQVGLDDTDCVALDEDRRLLRKLLIKIKVVAVAAVLGFDSGV
jgi:hypothetical protein